MAFLAHFEICCGSASLKDGVALVLDTATRKATLLIALSEAPPKSSAFEHTSELQRVQQT
jgi:hypothetical protein